MNHATIPHHLLALRILSNGQRVILFDDVYVYLLHLSSCDLDVIEFHLLKYM